MKPTVALKAFLAIAFWATSFVATKIALREISPLTVVALRFAIGAGVLILFVVARRQFQWPARGDLGWLILLGLNGITLHQLLQSNGLLTTTAANSGWIIALNPVFAALFAWLILREPFGKLKVLGLTIALSGALLVISRGQLGGGLLKLPATPGDVLMLLSSPNWALFTVLSKRWIGAGHSKLPPTMMIAVVMVFGWLAILPLWAASGAWVELARPTVAGWSGVLFLGLACSGLAYIFWYDALEHAHANEVSAFHYIQPFITVLVAALLLGENMTWITLLGGIVILFGVWLVNRPATKSAERKTMRAESRV
jgi:drug/metabolite transporter (DMT)-like permease